MNDENRDFLPVDPRSLSEEEYRALTKRVIAQAHIERSLAFRRALGHLKRWILGRSKPRSGGDNAPSSVCKVNQDMQTDRTGR